ncbi:MAG: hypothetical protein WBR26_02450 [Candidatus Acidiferrum sp.]
MTYREQATSVHIPTRIMLQLDSIRFDRHLSRQAIVTTILEQYLKALNSPGVEFRSDDSLCPMR